MVPVSLLNSNILVDSDAKPRAAVVGTNVPEEECLLQHLFNPFAFVFFAVETGGGGGGGGETERGRDSLILYLEDDGFRP